jgi:DNA gyrase inhibitor GyrI
MTAWHGGKGSGSRPKQVSDEDYANRWDAIFGRDKAKSKEEPIGKPLKEEPLKEDEND